MNIFYFLKKWPFRDINSKFQKNFSMTQSLANMGHQVYIASTDDEPDQSQQWTLRQYPVKILNIVPHKIPISLTSAKVKPQIAIFNDIEMQKMYSYHLYNKWNKCFRITQINQLNSLKQWREQQNLIYKDYYLTHPTNQINPSNLDKILNQNQIQSINRSDYCLCGNDYIYNILKRILKDSNMISLTSYGYPIQQYTAEIKNLQYRPFENRRNFIFIGDVYKQSNLNMIDNLAKKIWPAIRSKLLDAQLHIYGSGYNKMLQNCKKQYESMGIHLKGFLSDLDDISRYRVMLYPCSSGSGYGGRIVDSWMSHTPVITTPVGALGFFLQTIEEKFTTSLEHKSGFINERDLTDEQLARQFKIKQYYDNNKFSQQIKDLHFGGICNNYSFMNFAQNAINLYQDENQWNQKVKIIHKIFVKNQNQAQLQINLRQAFIKAQMNIQIRRSGSLYQQQWKNHSMNEQITAKKKKK